MKKQIACLTTFLVLEHGLCAGYEVPNHFDISLTSVDKSVLSADGKLLANLGLRDLAEPFRATSGKDTEELTDDCKHDQVFPIRGLIACGAEFEDIPGTRAFNHFYDPTNGQPLTIRFGDSMVRPGDLLNKPNHPSPHWALEGPSDTQFFSYRDARNALYDALITGGNQTLRDASWGKMFQSLGQVIHHLQDMAQPQHVRNDEHVDYWWIPGYANPSWYEKYTKSSRTLARGQMGLVGSEPVYSSDRPGPYRAPRDFWENASGTGIAQFTNANFVSAGTNFQMRDGQAVSSSKYALPRPGETRWVPIEDLDPPVSQAVADTCQNLNCTMTFYASNETVANERASARSIFDDYVQLRPVTYSSFDEFGDRSAVQVDRIFSLNKYNFHAAYPLLLPRAVAYSAGLINYFFRGKVEISLPDEGAYSILDNAIERDAQTGGFHSIKLKLRNVTPAGSATEPMQEGRPGALHAVVKFHRNNCYRADLSGEYGSPGENWLSCRSPSEEIVVSLGADVPTGINASAQAITFNFLTPIPVDATDIYLQVVYRGPLGDEGDAVVVATRDISEPNYVGMFNTKEQYLYGVGPQPWTHTFKEWFCDGEHPELSYEECKATYSRTCYAQYAANQALLIAPENLDATNATIAVTIPVSRFSRAAILTEPGQGFGSVRCVNDIDGATDLADSGPLQTYPPNQLDPETDTLVPRRYLQARGIYATDFDSGYATLTAGDAPSPPLMDAVPVRSTIRF